jgi:hypothetical protein
MIALEAQAASYIQRFGECKPEWYVFARRERATE